MKTLAIIPARGGSKRIPRKNIKDFLGKPIIAYSIEAALSSKLFNEVMVSTEDDEIADIAIGLGAIVPFKRSESASNDYATTVDVLMEVLTAYQSKGIDFEFVCCIYPTAPLISIAHLKVGWEKLNSEELDAVVPIVAYSHPVWRALKIDKGQRIKLLWPEFRKTRTQDLDRVFHDAGQCYWLRTRMLFEEHTLFPEKSGSIELSEFETQDIDNVSDWNLAELKWKLRNEKSIGHSS